MLLKKFQIGSERSAFEATWRDVHHFHASRHAIQKDPMKSCRASVVYKSIAKSDERSLLPCDIVFRKTSPIVWDRCLKAKD
jgi:CRISPR/Cas system CSM-associated protein Csm3 (group 7 of RAMP superfamily)